MIPIQDVIVHRGEPKNNNPFRGGVGVRERKNALEKLRTGQNTIDYSFWDGRLGMVISDSRLVDRRIIDKSIIAWHTGE